VNPYLSSAIMLILRWLQFIAANQVLQGQRPLERELMLSQLVDDSKGYADRLSNYTLNYHSMSDTDGKVM